MPSKAAYHSSRYQSKNILKTQTKFFPDQANFLFFSFSCGKGRYDLIRPATRHPKTLPPAFAVHPLDLAGLSPSEIRPSSARGTVRTIRQRRQS